MVWWADLLGRTCTYNEELNIPKDLHTADSCILPPADCPAVAARGVQPSDVPSAVASVVSSVVALAVPSADLIELRHTGTLPLASHASMHKLAF